MKIAQAVCVYPPYRGGIGKAAADCTEIFKHLGHEVKVFTPLPAGPHLADSAEAVYLKPVLRMGNAALLPSFFSCLDDFDIIYLHYPFFGAAEIIYFSRLLAEKKPKLVIHYHMDILKLGAIKSLFLLPDHLIRNNLFRMADAVVCASLDYIESSRIKGIYRQMPDRFFEIPFSVDTELFVPSVKADEDGSVNILFVGGMDKAHYFKGVDRLIEAFAALKDKRARLSLVGNGELIPFYKQLAEKLNVSDRVGFYSGLDNAALREKYKQADIFVLPSVNSHEAFGIVLLEAMSCGLPVVASDLPGVRKVFEDGKHGYLVPPADNRELYTKLEQLVCDKQRRIEMGESARRYCLEKYSKQSCISNYRKLISRLSK